MRNQQLTFNSSCNRVHWCALDVDHIRIGWKLIIEFSDYGVNRLRVEVLNLTVVSVDSVETQIKLDDYNILTPINTDGITVFGLMPENIQLKGKQILITFK